MADEEPSPDVIVGAHIATLWRAFGILVAQLDRDEAIDGMDVARAIRIDPSGDPATAATKSALADLTQAAIELARSGTGLAPRAIDGGEK